MENLTAIVGLISTVISMCSFGAFLILTLPPKEENEDSLFMSEKLRQNKN